MDCKDETSIILRRDGLEATITLKRKREAVSTTDSCESNCNESLSQSSVTSNETNVYRTQACQSVYEADVEDYKRPKIAAEKVKGSVQYEQFPAEVFALSSKLSGQNSSCFFKSGPPARIMFNDHGEWKDFPEVANSTLCEWFRHGKTSTEISIDGRRYSVNFLQMLQLNLVTGYIRSIAWIDINDKCFFPTKCVEGAGNDLLSKFLDTCDHPNCFTEVDSKSSIATFSSRKDGLISVESESPTESEVIECGAAPSHLRPVEGHSSHDFALLSDKIKRLEDSSPEFTKIKNLFFAGLGMLATYATVTNIYKDCHKSTSGQSRLQAFNRQEEITKIARGDANLKHAWHGTSKQGVSGIVLHGFGQPRIPKNGALYGVGVYLAPEDYSHVSAVYSDVDENGEQHMVLCRTIMGNVEQVPHGSEQFHPSSEDYDTGVDDISSPKRYIIWSTHMNTHILPEYIISFKLASPWHDIITALRGNGKKIPTAKGLRLDSQIGDPKMPVMGTGTPKLDLKQGCSSRAPRSPWMSFPMLFLVMKSKLPPVKMHELQQYYLQFKAGRLPRDQLIRVVRSIAGDRLLSDSIRSMQAQEKVNQSVSGSMQSLGAEEPKEEKGM